MKKKQKDLIETARINDQSISSQSKPREVDIKASIEDFDHCYWELNVVTNTTEFTDKIKSSKGCTEDDIDFFYNEIIIHSFPTLDNQLIDDYILSYVSCCITESELETRMIKEDGDGRIVVEVIIHTQHDFNSSVSFR
jgi:hypothetical protein